MNNNHNQASCHTSLGRIALLVRMDWGLYGRSLLIAAGFFALLCFGLPRVGLLSGQSLDAFINEYTRASDLLHDVSLWFGYVLGFLGWLLYCNRRVQHTLSSAFALLPVRLVEHTASALIFGVWMLISMWGAIQASQLLSWLTMPVDIDWHWRLLPLDVDLEAYMTGVNESPVPFISKILSPILGVLAVMLLGLWFSIRFRNIIKGWFLWALSVVLGSVTLITPAMYLSALAGYGGNGEMVIKTDAGSRIVQVVGEGWGWGWTLEDREIFVYTYVALLSLGLITLVLWRIYHQLKTVAR